MVNDADSKCEGHEETQLSREEREREDLTEFGQVM